MSPSSLWSRHCLACLAALSVFLVLSDSLVCHSIRLIILLRLTALPLCALHRSFVLLLLRSFAPLHSLLFFSFRSVSLPANLLFPLFFSFRSFFLPDLLLLALFFSYRSFALPSPLFFFVFVLPRLVLFAAFCSSRSFALPVPLLALLFSLSSSFDARPFW